MNKRKKNPAIVALGKKVGQAIAQRGPEYFKQLQAKRKNRREESPTSLVQEWLYSLCTAFASVMYVPGCRFPYALVPGQ